MHKYMNPIDNGTTPKVLLLGNGINKAFNADDWEGLLRKLSDGKLTEEVWQRLRRLPYPLFAVAALDDRLDVKLKEFAEDLTLRAPSQEEAALLKRVLKLGFDTILTTNYTYEIEKALIPGFRCAVGRTSKFRFKTFCLRKNLKEIPALFEYMDDSVKESPVLPIWHIHGEAAKPDTMILGHYYYGNLLGLIRGYIGETVKRHKMSCAHDEPYCPCSWVDYFLFGDVHIVGQGMDFSEMDLWWLINCKKRNGKGHIYFYEPNVAPEKKLLAETYGVTIITETVREDGFREYYSRTLDSLRVL